MKLNTLLLSLATSVAFAFSAQASTVILASDSNIFGQASTSDNEVFFQNVFNGKNVVNFSGRSLISEGTTATETNLGTSAAITSGALAGQDFMIFGYYRTSVSASELAAIDAFHNAGGSLFLYGEGASAFNSLNSAVNSILSTVGSTMSLSLSASDNLVSGGFTSSSVTGATSLATGVNTWRSAFASGINLGSGTAAISGDFGNGFGVAVAVEGLSDNNSVTPVPVPAGLPLAASGLGLLAALGWRKRQISHHTAV